MRLSDLVARYGDTDPIIAVLDPRTGAPVDPEIEEGVALLDGGACPYLALSAPAGGE